MLRCTVTEHLALLDCKLINESPAGYGFGEAALTLAGLSAGNPQVSAARQNAMVTFAFSLNPPSISPNTLGPYHLTMNADWAEVPKARGMAQVYPRRAFDLGLTGRVTLDCLVGLNGKLSSCSVLDETPAGYGFGDAALKWAPSFKMKPETLDGHPVAGGHIELPIVFHALTSGRR